MHALPGPADIHTDDEGTGLVLIDTDSRRRQDARYIPFFLVSESAWRKKESTYGAGRLLRENLEHSLFPIYPRR